MGKGVHSFGRRYLAHHETTCRARCGVAGSQEAQRKTEPAVKSLLVNRCAHSTGPRVEGSSRSCMSVLHDSMRLVHGCW